LYIASGIFGLLLAAPARAQQGTNTALAEALFREGKQLMAEGNYAEACPKIAESQRLDPGTGTLLNLASCHEAAGKIASAWAEYGEAASLARRDGRADREDFATKHAAALEPTIPHLLLDVTGAAQSLQSLEIRIDDVVVGRVAWSIPAPIDPGPHTVTASAAGKKPLILDLVVPATPDMQQVHITDLEDAPREAGPAAPGATGSIGTSSAPPASNDAGASGSNGKKVGLAIGAGGLLAIGVGSFFGLRAYSKWDERNKHCPSGECDATAVAASDAAHTSARIADIAMGVGIVGLGVGTYLFLTARPSSKQASATRTYVGVGSVARGAPGFTAGGVW
jgi:hypothetical protein